MRKITVPAVAAIIITVIYSFLNLSPLKSDIPDKAEVLRLPEKITQTGSKGVAPNSFIEAEVTKVVDGDTIDVKYKNKTYKVRLLCVDTPESVKTGVKLQAFGKEASEFTRNRILGKQIKLVFDKGLRDRYGRLLAYVIVNEGYFLNAELVRQGYARVEIVSPNSSLSAYFKDLQQQAVNTKSGFWALPENKQPFAKGKNGNYVPRYWDEKTAS